MLFIEYGTLLSKVKRGGTGGTDDEDDTPGIDFEEEPTRFGNLCATELIQTIEQNGLHKHITQDYIQIVNSLGAKLNQKKNDLNTIYISHREPKNRTAVGFFLRLPKNWKNSDLLVLISCIDFTAAPLYITIDPDMRFDNTLNYMKRKHNIFYEYFVSHLYHKNRIILT